MLADVLGRLSTWLEKNRPDYFEILSPPASAEDLDAANLPPALRTLYAWHDGQGDGGATSLVGSFFFPSLEQLLLQRSSNAETARDIGRPDWWSDEWFPFLDDGAGNLVCAVGEGEVIEYFHDNNGRPRVGPSVEAVFDAITCGFEENVLVSDGMFYVPADVDDWEPIRKRFDIEPPFGE